MSVRDCSSKEDFKRFVDLKRTFSTKDIKDYGCLKANCKSVFWTIVKPTAYALGTNNSSVISFSFDSQMPVVVVRHSLSYMFPNFVADFGGYLGLLLGASVLSVYDMCIMFIEKYIALK